MGFSTPEQTFRNTSLQRCREMLNNAVALGDAPVDKDEIEKAVKNNNLADLRRWCSLAWKNFEDRKRG